MTFLFNNSKRGEIPSFKITFLDLETTSPNPNTTEILTAYLSTRSSDDFRIIESDYLTFRPDLYLHDSYPIHKIGPKECDLFDDKWDSYRKLLSYLRRHRDGLFCCHANHHVFGTYGYFDRQVIEQVAFSHTLQTGKPTYYWLQRQGFRFISTHTIAKKKIKIPNYSLDKVYEYFFNEEFAHHKCEEDVKATERIFREMINYPIEKEELYKIGNYKEIK